mmetsp:Transcript_69873/g.123199  ORF Transcript_69873/g.123199 Transcript_69873/m.123199 type:complete len:324 (+) Transcript_69873:118-1089(+)
MPWHVPWQVRKSAVRLLQRGGNGPTVVRHKVRPKVGHRVGHKVQYRVHHKVRLKVQRRVPGLLKSRDSILSVICLKTLSITFRPFLVSHQFRGVFRGQNTPTSDQAYHAWPYLVTYGLSALALPGLAQVAQLADQDTRRPGPGADRSAVPVVTPRQSHVMVVTSPLHLQQSALLRWVRQGAGLLFHLHLSLLSKFNGGCLEVLRTGSQLQQFSKDLGQLCVQVVAGSDLQVGHLFGDGQVVVQVDNLLLLVPQVGEPPDAPQGLPGSRRVQHGVQEHRHVHVVQVQALAHAGHRHEQGHGLAGLLEFLLEVKLVAVGDCHLRV